MLNIRITLQVIYVLILGSFIVPHLISASVVTTFMELFYATNDVSLLGCYCMTLNKTGDYEVGKCFIGCTYGHLLSKSHIYNPVPQDTTKLNQSMCRGLRKNGTMCGDCLPNHSLGVLCREQNFFTRQWNLVILDEFR